MKKLIAFLSTLAITAFIAAGCRPSEDNVTENPVQSNGNDTMVTAEEWGELDGEKVHLYTLTNKNGIQVRLSDYGGTIVSVMAPDRQGKFADVVLGFDSPGEYPEKSQYFGCITGRYANRIAKGKFTLDGTEYTLAVNNGPNHLHGGVKGFDKQIWSTLSRQTDDGPQVVMNWTSPDGDEGYPGKLDCEVTYTLTDQNELRIDYKATTDQPTVINLTNHTYFNLKGAGEGTILDHEIMIPASQFCATDETNIPQPGLAEVEGTPLDFRTPTLIGERIDADHVQLKNGLGYDHNWVLKHSRDHKMTHAATLVAPETGRTLEVYTTEPGIQFYTGNFLDGRTGKGGAAYVHRGALCLEAQTFPDAPNRPDFPSPVLRPGETYQQTTIYKFGFK